MLRMITDYDYIKSMYDWGIYNDSDILDCYDNNLLDAGQVKAITGKTVTELRETLENK